jgi:hypothetical protein
VEELAASQAEGKRAAEDAAKAISELRDSSDRAQAQMAEEIVALLANAEQEAAIASTLLGAEKSARTEAEAEAWALAEAKAELEGLLSRTEASLLEEERGRREAESRSAALYRYVWTELSLYI